MRPGPLTVGLAASCLIVALAAPVSSLAAPARLAIHRRPQGGKGVHCSEVEEARWGSVTKIQLPGGGEVGLYQPKHPSPLSPTSN